MLVFLWRPIFTRRALLPGDYLAQMQPWASVASPKSKVQSQDSQHPELVEGSGNPGPQWNPLEWDAISQFYPWRVFYARSMRSGHIPLWNPHQFSGTPFLANGQSACLYPFNLIFLIFNPITAFTIFAALHLFLAQVFMYWLMRELGAKQLGGIIAAIVFAFSAFMVLWLELPTFISVAVWLPLALLLVNRAVERRSAFHGMLAGLVLGLAFLAGHFQIAFYVVLATALWWLWKAAQVWRAEGKTYVILKVIVPLAACVTIAGLIAAPQILPTQELAANSHRVREASEDGYQTFIDNALPAYRLVTAFAPKFFGDPSENDYYLLGRIGDSRHVGSAADYMEYGMYAGILPLMLALIALGSIKRRHVGFFVMLTVLALLTATGTPINRLFYFGLPGFSALGGPNRILLLYLFGIAALAGFGADYYIDDSATAKVKLLGKQRLLTRVHLCAAWFAALLLLRVASWIGQSFLLTLGSRRPPIWGEPPLAAAWLLASLLFLGAYMRVAGASEPTRFLSRQTVSVLAVLLIVADLFAFGINYNPTCDRSEVYPKTALTNELQRLQREWPDWNWRIAPINPKWSLFETPKDAILPPNAAMVYGLYDIQGYDSLYTKAYKDWSCAMQGEDSSPIENGNMVFAKRFTSGFLGARFIITSDDLSGVPVTRRGYELRLMGNYDGLKLYSYGPSFLRRLRPRRSVREDEVIKSFWDGPNRFVIKTKLPGRMTYVLPVAFADSHWIARMNGKRIRTYYLFGRQIRNSGTKGHQMAADAIGPGTLVFSYEPFAFRLGLFLMLVGVGAISCVGTYRLARSGSGKAK